MSRSLYMIPTKKLEGECVGKLHEFSVIAQAIYLDLMEDLEEEDTTEEDRINYVFPCVIGKR